MPKRIVLCCDGTWNTPDQTRGGRVSPTNVTKMAAAVVPVAPDGTRQAVYYQRGVGTSRWERIRGGAFGVGLSRGVRDVYRFVVANYAPGDELYFFGFSRGAYTARSVAGLIRNAGILRPENADRIPQAYALYRARSYRPKDVESRLFRASFSHEDVRVRFIGVWDTVGALGLPWSNVPVVKWFNRRWSFHDTQLSSAVDAAFHALAIDEERGPFRPAVWRGDAGSTEQVLEQVWFAGVHSDVGGGYAQTGLSDIALRWMAERAREHGLALLEGAFTDEGEGAVEPLDGDETLAFAPSAVGPVHNSRKGFYRVLPRYRRTLGSEPTGNEYAASSAVERAAEDPTYAPENLAAFVSEPNRVRDV